MHSLLDSISASTQVAHRRHRLEHVAAERRAVVNAISAALVGATDRLRHGRDPAGQLVALPATASVIPSDDQTSPSWSPGRVA